MKANKNTKRRMTFAPRRMVVKKGIQFDYKEPKVLIKFLTETGSISGREVTTLSQKQQRELAKQIKRARHLAMLPFTQTL